MSLYGFALFRVNSNIWQHCIDDAAGLEHVMGVNINDDTMLCEAHCMYRTRFSTFNC